MALLIELVPLNGDQPSNMLQKFPKLFWAFLIGLFLLNILQSIYTDLIYDEAYYWYYSNQLDGGYFDHPPMVALMIWLGGLLFDGELGVRLVGVFFGIGTFMALWLLVDDPRKNKYVAHFFLLLSAMVLLNVYGFFTLPDTPLLFFTACFLLAYKGYLKNPSLQNGLLLGVLMAALMYSKYHAVLVIVFVLLSNLGLLKQRNAWIAVGAALLCYLPHFVWLNENAFVTIAYHLSERPNHEYGFAEFTLGYFLNLIVIFGLLFPWVYGALFKTKAEDRFTKALLYLTYGVIAFFFVSSFQRRAQAQWAIVICIPLAVLAFRHLIANKNSRIWMFRMSLVSFVIVLYARLWLIFPSLLPFTYEAHGNAVWVERLKAKVGETPVVFRNSYRRAPMFSFYSGEPSYTHNTITYRRNQYSIDSSEAWMQHKKVAYVAKADVLPDSSVVFSYRNVDDSKFEGTFIEAFETYRKLQCELLGDADMKQEGFRFSVYNPYDSAIALEKLDIRLAYLDRYKELDTLVAFDYETRIPGTTELKANDTTFFKARWPRVTANRPSYLKFAIAENGLEAGINSTSIKVLE